MNHTSAQPIEDVIRTMTERIVKRFRPVKVVLFGSWARGDAGPDSDVDLLIILPRVRHKRLAAIEIRRLLADMPVGKDIVVSSPEEVRLRGNLVGTVLRPALREGRILYERA